MEMDEKIYQIQNFTELVNATYIESTGSDTSVHYNTVDSWFKQLEKEGVHYIQRIDGFKVYDKTDLKIALFIMDKRKDSRWKLKGIFSAIEQTVDTRPFPIEYEHNALLEEKDINEILDKKIGRMKFEILEEIINSNKIQNMLPEPIDKKEIVNNVINSEELQNLIPKPLDHEAIIQDIMLRMKEDSENKLSEIKKLRSAAISEWEKKDESYRLIKVGFFKRVEDSTKRENFINDYINEHLT